MTLTEEQLAEIELFATEFLENGGAGGAHTCENDFAEEILLLVAALREAWGEIEHLKSMRENFKIREQLKIAKQEIDCLRSVLSEWDEDKSCFVQFIKANDLRNDRESIEGPSRDGTVDTEDLK